jgi:two-component system NarL family sensor kinase
VARTGQPERFEIYLKSLKRWFSISAYCPKMGSFIAVFSNITERKEAEQRMQILSQEIVAAREEERRQVSSVLHQDAGSLAVGISAYFDVMEKDLNCEKPREALRWLKRTRELFAKSVAGLKDLAIEIRPPELDLLGLGAALRQHFSRITKRSGTRIRFRDRLEGRRVPAEAATILFRVAQEALTNAIRHGQARRVDIHLGRTRENIRLTIRDNGKGFDPAGRRGQARPGLGLRIMREMAASAGGDFALESRQGNGTTIRVSLSLAAAGPGTPGVTAGEGTAKSARAKCPPVGSS